MGKKKANKTGKIRVILSGCVPPPMGGMAMFYQFLLGSSLPKQLDVHFVQTSSQNRPLSSSGSATVSNLVSALRDCGRFARAAWLHRPQVSHIGTAAGWSFMKHSVCVGIASLLGNRVLLHPHCSLTVLYDEKAALWQWLFRRIIKWTDGVVTLSTEWNQIRSIVPACRVFCLPNAIDLMPYRQAAQERMAQGKRKRSLKILYMGYLGKAKGSFDLIEAAKQTALDGMEVSFDLVGDELTSGAKLVLRQCVDDANLNGRVRIHPPASGSEKLAFFRNADIFIYPSYHEGMPIAVLEAMACGLPIVATRVGGLPDLVVDGFNGVLAEPGRPDQLAAALYRLSMDDGVRRSMEQRSLQLAVDRYDMEQCVARLVGIYEAVLADGPGRKETHAGFGQSV